MTRQSEIAAFLMARYAEREAALRALLEARATDELPDMARGPQLFIEAHDDGLLGQTAAVRELFDDLAAKRAIVERYEQRTESMRLYPMLGNASEMMALTEVVAALAQPFSAHPGFDRSWWPLNTA